MVSIKPLSTYQLAWVAGGTLLTYYAVGYLAGQANILNTLATLGGNVNLQNGKMIWAGAGLVYNTVDFK